VWSKCGQEKDLTTLSGFDVGNWPQGQHPYVHHDPDRWLGWSFFPARWLLSCGQLSVDLWDVEGPVDIFMAVERAEAVRPLLDERHQLGLQQALGDIFRPSDLS
jgi:hypothetical protein